MSVEQLKQALMTLSEAEQNEVTAFLFYLRHRADPLYQGAINDRLPDSERSHWLNPEEFEQRLDEK